jgi:hypothetical protein
VRATNLHSYYSLGVALERLYDNISIEKMRAEVFMYVIEPYNLLLGFLAETEDMPIDDTRGAATYLHKFCEAFYKSVAANPNAGEQKIHQNEVSMFSNGKDQFEKAFEREYRNLDVFTVMQKGTSDTRTIMRAPENDVPQRLRKFLPPKTLDDLREAGKCLAFDVPTACAFHVCRGTEALILSYFEALYGHPWHLPNNRDWHAYIQHLENKGAPETITTRLHEIRKMERNPYTHPEKTVSLEEAPLLFRLCHAVTFYMCLEMEKLNP